jgi:rod shape-determining protein MreD
MFDPFRWSPGLRRFLNWAVIVLSVVFCLLVLPMRLPGMELLGVAPNWMLIWVVVWSVNRTVWEGAIAGTVLGLIQDGMTTHDPTNVISLALVGILTARIRKQRYIQEDFISIALIVFGMAVLAETAIALQFSLGSLQQRNVNYPSLSEIWIFHQQIALCSAILSSLWAPVLYYPLKRWWRMIETVEQAQTG